MDEFERRIMYVLRHHHKTWSANGGLLLSEIAILAKMHPLYAEHILMRLAGLRVVTTRLCDMTPKRAPFRRYYLAREATLNDQATGN